MKFLAVVKSWWAAHLTIVLGVVAFLNPSVERYAVLHPGQGFAGILTLVVGAILSPMRPIEKAALTQTTAQTTEVSMPAKPAATTTFPPPSPGKKS